MLFMLLYGHCGGGSKFGRQSDGGDGSRGMKAGGAAELLHKARSATVSAVAMDTATPGSAAPALVVDASRASSTTSSVSDAVPAGESAAKQTTPQPLRSSSGHAAAKAGGGTLLHCAVEGGNADIVTLLLDAGTWCSC